VRRHKSAAHQFVLSKKRARATAAAAVAYFSDLFISRRCSSSQAILSLTSSREKVQAKVIIRLRHRRGLMIVMHVDRSRQVHTPFILHLLHCNNCWLSLCVHAIYLGYYSDQWRHLQQDLIFFL
jgi:hypothetical protein